jgi:hypothetical protein
MRRFDGWRLLRKLSEAATQFEMDKVAFVVELGDLIDAADSVDVEQSYLKTINREFSAISKDRHYVLGNHCVDTLTKQEFLASAADSLGWQDQMELFSHTHGWRLPTAVQDRRSRFPWPVQSKHQNKLSSGRRKPV